MKNIDQNWENCLQVIKKHVSSQAFETWFASIDVVGVEKHQITLQVPNRFHYEWLESKYGELLERGLKKSFGTQLTINYSVLINNTEESSSLENVKKILRQLQLKLILDCWQHNNSQLF